MKSVGYLVLLLALATFALFALGLSAFAGIALVLTIAALALFFMGHPKLKSFAFTIWVLAFVAASLLFPQLFGTWLGLNLSLLIVPLIQIIMFGMGTTLSLKDFTRIIKMPVPVFIGIFLQYLIMPFVGLALAILFRFEPEVAAGLILIGACPGGVASNLINYLAGANVALSVTMTACSTLVSPIMTPFMMKMLAGKLVPISFPDMMLSIFNMIIIPVIAGLIANKILYSKKRAYSAIKPLMFIAIAGFCLAVLFAAFSSTVFGIFLSMRSGLIVGSALIGLVAAAKLIITVRLHKPDTWMDKTLPLVSMAGICLIIAIITARSADKLLTVGPAIILAAMMHNLLGYSLGYWGARALRQNVIDSRTIAVEVGMQNGGMASGLAMSVLKSAPVALASAIFGPWQNVSGSILANYWRKKFEAAKNKS
jgi:bile acid:Na+ symporter, BASS family